MNPLLLHTSRKALLTATITMVAGVVLLFLYWTAAIHGVVPSPGRPLVSGHSATNTFTNQIAFHAAAEPPPKRSASADPSENASSANHARPAEAPALWTGNSAAALSEAPAAPSAPVNQAAIAPTPPVTVQINREPPPTPTTPVVTNASRSQLTASAAVVLPAATWQDENVARRWAVFTNDRPTVRISYTRRDIVQLLTAGRGILIASAGGQGQERRREFCLVSPPATNPEYVTFTSSHASRFAKFGIALHREGELARLAAPLPAYFSGAEYTLEFVPDHSLARIIFTQVSRAMRAVNPPPTNQANVVFEGELRLEAGQPDFVMTKVRAGNREHDFACKEDGSVRTTN